MKKETFGDLTFRQVSPLGRIPRKYVRKFLNKDPEVIDIVKRWIEKNGLIILFTQGKAKGWEKVWVTDEGVIYLNDEEHLPTKEEIHARLRKVFLSRREEVPQDLLDAELEDQLKFLRENEKPI
jgi:hypothetical protein